ncbi:DP-EP family protein [Alteromonadaceae bacterium M269]|nr:DP-EP family protein [Alteromonadaceae bacterium M269]
MSAQVQTVKTRVSTINNKPVVQFYNADTGAWETDVTLTFTQEGKAKFSLEEDSSYIFFGALQCTSTGATPDTGWDFKVTQSGNMIKFNNSCQNKQNIDIKLTLIPRGEIELKDAIISADPKIRNQPD